MTDETANDGVDSLAIQEPPGSHTRIAFSAMSGGSQGRSAITEWLRSNVVYVSLLVIFLVSAALLADQGFLSTQNLLNIVRQAAPITIMAVAMVFVLSSGEIDLSIGSIVPLSALAVAVGIRDGNLVIGLGFALGVSLLVGLLNGVLVAYVRIPSFLVTLASFQGVYGVARRMTNEQAVPVVDPTFIGWFGGSRWGLFPTIILWALAAAVIAGMAYSTTRFGAHIRATGDDRSAAKSLGINVNTVRIAAFAISAFAAGVAGILNAGQLQGARYTLGQNDLLLVIAAAIIGGTSLFGGKGSVPGAAAGALLLALLNNALILYGLSVSEQQIALGAIIVLAVVLGRERANE